MTKRIETTMGDEPAEALEAAAKQRGLTLASLVRMVLLGWLSKEVGK